MADLNAVADLLAQAATMLKDYRENGLDNEGRTEPVGPTHKVKLEADVSGIIDDEMASAIIERELNSLAAENGLDVFEMHVMVTDL